MPIVDRLNAVLGGEIAQLRASDLDGFLEAHRLAFVDFWASWCRPCRAMAPVIRSLAREYGKDVAFGKVDTEAEREAAERFSVRSIPTYILFKGARPVERFPGATTRDRLARKIEKWL